LFLAAIVVLAAIAHAEARLMPAIDPLLWPYTQVRARQLLFEYFGGICATAFLLYAASASRSSGFRSRRGWPIVTALVLAGLYSLLLLTVQPQTERRLAGIRLQNAKAVEAIEHALEARARGDLNAARRHLRERLIYDPEDPSVNRMLQAVETQLMANTRTEADTVASEEPEPGRGREDGPSAAALAVSARGHFTARDYATAAYFAGRALAIDPANTDARDLLEASQTAIGALAPSPEEERSTRLFGVKSDGRRALDDGDPIRAYYILRDLADEFPDDRELQEFLTLSRVRLSELAFFTDEVPTASDDVAVVRQIAFVPGERAGVSWVGYADELIVTAPGLTGAGIYLRGLEMVGFDGGLRYHFRLPQALVMARGINLQPLDSGRREESPEPEYLEGRDVLKVPQIPLCFDPLLLSLLSLERQNPGAFTTSELWALRDDLPAGAGTRALLEVELLMRGLRPLTFLVLLLLALGLGSRTRPLGRLESRSFLLLPAPVIAAQLVHVGLIYCVRVGVAYLYEGWGLPTALAGGSVLALILIVGALAWREGTFSRAGATKG
jgi:hypothetical protein